MENAAHVSIPPAPFLDTRQAAKLLQLSHRTLERWRLEGQGPVFVKMGGAVRYRMADLEAWAEAQLRRSTSDPGKAA
jgi:excisionase family DNA binding protein